MLNSVQRAVHNIVSLIHKTFCLLLLLNINIERIEITTLHGTQILDILVCLVTKKSNMIHAGKENIIYLLLLTIIRYIKVFRVFIVFTLLGWWWSATNKWRNRHYLVQGNLKFLSIFLVT